MKVEAPRDQNWDRAIAEKMLTAWIPRRAFLKAPESSWTSSIMQMSLHPSLDSRLPSSHCSFPTVSPSPQIGEHLAGNSHVHPASALHSKQPSPLF